jgi:ADP-ribose pyrophosphatase
VDVSRARRLTRYEELRKQAPELFVNPPDGVIEIVTDPADVLAAESTMRDRLVDRGLPASWSETGVVFEDQYTVIVRDAVRLPDGTLGTHVRSLAPAGIPGVVILPVMAGHVVLVRHFRHSTRGWHLELPRGFGSPGSTPEDDARRELLEEIGAEATALVDLGRIHPDTGMSSSSVCLFLAEVDAIGEPEAEEGISAIEMVTTERFEELIRDGQITDGFSINAYARARLLNLLPGLR